MRKIFKTENIVASGKLLFIDFSKQDNSTSIYLLLVHYSKMLSVFALTEKKRIPDKVQVLSSLSPHFFNQISEIIDYVIIVGFDNSKQKETLKYIASLRLKAKKILLILLRDFVLKNTELIENSKKFENVSIALVGEIFGKNYLNNRFTKIIANAAKTGEIISPQDTLQNVFLISEEDLFFGIDYLLFSNQKKGLYPLYYKFPQTFSSCIHILKRLIHDAYIVSYYDVHTNLEQISDKKLQKNVGNFAMDIEHSFLGFEKSAKELIESNPDLFIDSLSLSKKKQKKNRLNFNFISQAFFFLTTLLISFFLISLVGMFFSFILFKNAISDISNSKFEHSFVKVASAEFLYTYSAPQVLFIVSQVDFISKSKFLEFIQKYGTALEATKSLVLTIAHIESQKSAITREQLENITSNIFILYFFAKDTFPSYLSGDLLEVKQFFPLLPVFDDILGFKKEMNYLILFQNNNELRPTGGFIGSIAHLVIKDAKIKSIEVRDVYELDGQLTKHIEPHFVIRRYLQPHLYLRDSNFHPDFPITASSAASLYSMVSGKKVDGVIGIDTEVLKKLIDIGGEIHIPGISETLTSKNIVNLLEESIQDDFFPGSNEKKNLLSSVLSKVIITFENDKKKQIEFLKALPVLFKQKHILISFADVSLQKGAVAAGIAGSLDDLRLEANTFRDTLFINEANIGVNKINKFVERRVGYNAIFSKDGLKSYINMEYKNKGTENYTMYLRVLVPQQAMLEQVIIEGTSQFIVPGVVDSVFYERPDFVAPQGLEVSEEKMLDLKAFGFKVIIPKNSSKNITVITNRKSKGDDTSITYSLRFIKQPGTLSYPLKIELQTTDGYKVVSQKKANKITLFNKDVLTDIEVTAVLQKTK